MQEINSVLVSHFDDFGLKVAEAYIRPLKIKDSVPKYRVPIPKILTGWLEDDVLLTAMSNAALQDRRGSDLNACRSDLLRRIFWVKERYDNMEREFLDEIDQQVRRYTRATTQKIENLTNRDHRAGYANICEIGRERIRRAGKKLLEEGITKVSRSNCHEKAFQEKIAEDGMNESESQINFDISIESMRCL